MGLNERRKAEAREHGWDGETSARSCLRYDEMHVYPPASRVFVRQ